MFALRIKDSDRKIVPVHKWSFRPISASCSKNNARNITYMPVLIFFAILDLERKSSFLDRHKITMPGTDEWNSRDFGTQFK